VIGVKEGAMSRFNFVAVMCGALMLVLLMATPVAAGCDVGSFGGPRATRSMEPTMGDEFKTANPSQAVPDSDISRKITPPGTFGGQPLSPGRMDPPSALHTYYGPGAGRTSMDYFDVYYGPQGSCLDLAALNASR
jgi:hypothetical protein